jgi:hypothetical protein
MSWFSLSIKFRRSCRWPSHWLRACRSSEAVGPRREMHAAMPWPLPGIPPKSSLHWVAWVATRRLHLLHTPCLPPHHQRGRQSPQTTRPRAATSTAVPIVLTFSGEIRSLKTLKRVRRPPFHRTVASLWHLTTSSASRLGSRRRRPSSSRALPRSSPVLRRNPLASPVGRGPAWPFSQPSHGAPLGQMWPTADLLFFVLFEF